MDVSWEPSEQIDVGPLGRLTAQVMEQVSGRYGSDASLRTVAVLCEIDTETCSEILVVCSDPRAWVQLAFLEEGKVSLERALDREEDE